MMTQSKHVNRQARPGNPTASRAGRAIQTLLAASALSLAVVVTLPVRNRQYRVMVVQSAAPTRYTITELGTNGGRFTAVHARSINDRGQIAGWADTPTHRRKAFLWVNGRFKDIGSPEDKYTVASDINNRGEAVGTAYEGKDFHDPHVVIFRGDKMIDTGIRGCGIGIDDRSRIVGETDPAHHAFLYDGHKLTDLGTRGGPSSRARSINNRGQIAGDADVAPGRSHAFLYSDSKMKDLGPEMSFGMAINDKGWVVGRSERGGGAQILPFLYRNGRSEPLGCLNLWCIPTAINATGTITGFSYEERFIVHALVWFDGRVYNLEDLIPPHSGWKLEDADGINERGQIVATGIHQGERGERSCVLTPVTGNRTEIAGRRELL